MKRSLLLTALIVTPLASAPATAEGPFIAAQSANEYLARDRLIGAKVRDDAGKIVADIEDLIITNDGQVVGAVMGVGGILGLGERRVAIPVSALNIEAADNGAITVTLPGITDEALKAAPEFQRAAPQKGWLQRATEKGLELRDKSAKTAKEAYDHAKEQAAPMIEKAKDAAQSASDKARDAMSSEPAADASPPSESAQPEPAPPAAP